MYAAVGIPSLITFLLKFDKLNDAVGVLEAGYICCTNYISLFFECFYHWCFVVRDAV